MKNSKTIVLIEVITVVLLLVLGGFLRFYQIQTRPGFEWDEPIYATIAENTAKYGYPVFVTEEGATPQINLYHPPFDHYLKGFWYQAVDGEGVGPARILSAIESILLLILVYLVTRQLGGRKVALVALLFVATDGWLIYTNRLNLIENGMMPIGVLGIFFYVLATKKGKLFYYFLAGGVLALAAIYKHTGLAFLLVPAFNLLLSRKNFPQHILLFSVSALTVLGYVASSYFIFGEEFLTQTLVQIRRALGMVPSRALSYNFFEILPEIVSRYWFFFTTIICLVIGLSTIIIRLTGDPLKKKGPTRSIILSWSIAATVFLIIISLKSPHYWIILLVPLYILIATESEIFLKKDDFSITATTVLVTLSLSLNLLTWNFLILEQDNNPLLETYRYVNQYLSPDARILTEEHIGCQIDQIYYNIQIHRQPEDLHEIDPTHIIIYRTITSQPLIDPGLEALLQRSILIQKYTGFKEEIEIYQIQSRQQIPGGILSFTFDDGKKSTFTQAFPILSSYHFPATVYIISDEVNQPEYLTLEQLHQLSQSGWEIASHSVTHPHLQHLPLSKIEEELKTSKESLENWGFTISSFAPPYGEFNQEIINLSKKYYSSTRQGNLIPQLNPTKLEGEESYYLKVFLILPDTTSTEVCSWIEKAHHENAWLILNFHLIGERGDWSWETEQLQEVAECTQQQGIEVDTIEGGVSQQAVK